MSRINLPNGTYLISGKFISKVFELLMTKDYIPICDLVKLQGNSYSKFTIRDSIEELKNKHKVTIKSWRNDEGMMVYSISQKYKDKFCKLNHIGEKAHPKLHSSSAKPISHPVCLSHETAIKGIQMLIDSNESKALAVFIERFISPNA